MTGRNNMMKENIPLGTWKCGREGTWWWGISRLKPGNMAEKEHDDGEYQNERERDMMMENIRIETWDYGKKWT
jgi:hypothetical protein